MQTVCARNARAGLLPLVLFVALFSVFSASAARQAEAQNYRFTSVDVDGNQRIETGTILTYAGIARGETINAGQLNQAYQRIVSSGLFESVSLEPRGNLLKITVKEYPTISKIAFEGNRKLKDDDLSGFIESSPRQVFNPEKAERDAQTIVEA